MPQPTKPISALIYDCEIKNAIPSDKEPRIEGIVYCNGWRDFENMGISVTGAYDMQDKRYRVFCDDNQTEFFDLCEQRDILVGFNSKNFDNNLIEAAWLYEIDEARHYDILRAVWTSVGVDPDAYASGTHSGYGLNDLAMANFGIGKTGHGSIAPIDWQQGKHGRVIDYCLNDITLTLRLFEKILEAGQLKSPVTGEMVEAIQPTEVFGKHIAAA